MTFGVYFWRESTLLAHGLGNDIAPVTCRLRQCRTWFQSVMVRGFLPVEPFPSEAGPSRTGSSHGVVPLEAKNMRTYKTLLFMLSISLSLCLSLTHSLCLCLAYPLFLFFFLFLVHTHTHTRSLSLGVRWRTPKGRKSTRGGTSASNAKFCASLPSKRHPQPSTLNPQPSTLSPQPSTLNSQPSALKPKP